MVVRYKQKCGRCRKNYVLIRRGEYSICYDCQKQDLEGEITDLTMKEMFSIPEEFYRESSFLRGIKINYLRFGKLSDKQIAAFRKVVGKMKESSQKE